MSTCPHDWFDVEELGGETSRVTPEGDEITVDGGWIACVATVVNGGEWCDELSSPFGETCWPHADWEQRWADEEWRRAVAPKPDVQWEGGSW